MLNSPRQRRHSSLLRTIFVAAVLADAFAALPSAISWALQSPAATHQPQCEILSKTINPVEWERPHRIPREFFENCRRLVA